MKIALAQMEVIPGRAKKNLENMLRMINMAKEKMVHLIAFPELCISGYLVGDKWTEDSFCKNMMSFNDDILKASKGIAIAYGNVFLDTEINWRVGNNNLHPNKDGRSRKYNAVYVVQDGQAAPRINPTRLLPAGVQPKGLLPNYRFFDDERYFLALEDIAKDFAASLESLAQPFLIEVDGRMVPIGFEICEDLWCEDYRRGGKAQDITKMLIQNGAQKIINISASPWTYGKNGARDRRIEFLKQNSGEDFVPFFYVNCVGVQNNGKNIVTFDGGSTVYNTEGQSVVLTREAYQEQLLVVEEVDLTKGPVSRTEKPRIAQKIATIIKGIQHVKDILGRKEQPKYILGMSGGVDSSVTAALLTLAVGADKVLGINMPTQFNSDKLKNSAVYTAQKLGIGYIEIPVGELADANEALLTEYNISGKIFNGKQRGNIAAKIRGTSVLSNLAAKHGALFTNNGNKLEVALGYATLYGDVNGAIAAIADLNKAEIFEAAKYLNEHIFRDEIIPEILLPDDLFRFSAGQAPPSAELETDQIDPMKFGYHDALLSLVMEYKKTSLEDFTEWFKDRTLHHKVGAALGREADYGLALMRRWKVDEPVEFINDLEWFLSTVQANTFKRVQSPPIIITSKTAYGYDLRESMLPWETSRRYDQLRQEVLGMGIYLEDERPTEFKEVKS